MLCSLGAAGAATRPAGSAVDGAVAVRPTRSESVRFHRAVGRIKALRYQPAYLATGYDRSFPGTSVPNTAPAQDYTTGSVPGSPDSPEFPPPFHRVLLRSPDGARFFGEVALHPGRRPAVLVVPGFNTNSKRSVVRWAAMLSANGYDVLAADQRDFAAEYQAGYGYPAHLQTFGWKESRDVLTAGRWLGSRPGVTSVGVVGFSEGGQNTVLALARDRGRTFAAGLVFSGPADQDTQIYSTAEPPGCSTPGCSYPATDALVGLVVPPYSSADVCGTLRAAADYYRTTGFDILARESAFHAQTRVRVPLLAFYAGDDPLVAPFQATMMAGYQRGNPLQRTLEVQRGGHAYYYDRWWQQRAILTYFRALLPGAAGKVTARATVNRTPGGAPLRDQLVGLGSPTRAQADRQLAPYICDTSQGSPG